MRREMKARIDAVQATLARLDDLIAREQLPADLAAALRVRHADRLRRLERHQDTSGVDAAVREGGEMERQLIEAERERIGQLRLDGALSDEARRRIERELDLEEARVIQAGRDPA